MHVKTKHDYIYSRIQEFLKCWTCITNRVTCYGNVGFTCPDLHLTLVWLKTNMACSKSRRFTPKNLLCKRFFNRSVGGSPRFLAWRFDFNVLNELAVYGNMEGRERRGSIYQNQVRQGGRHILWRKCKSFERTKVSIIQVCFAIVCG